MKYNNILENNKLIAQFMGGVITHTQEYEMPHGSHSTGVIEYWDKIKGKPIDGYEDAKVGIFGYNYSWDWLMPVVEKIENINDFDKYYKWKDIDDEERSNFAGYEVDIDRDRCKIWLNLELDPSELLGSGQEGDKLKSTYKAVVEFIKWYKE